MAAAQVETDAMAIPQIPTAGEVPPGPGLPEASDTGAAPTRRVALTGEVFEAAAPVHRATPNDLQLPGPGREEQPAAPGTTPPVPAQRKPVEEPPGKGWRRIMGR
jgi:hypothetical protein